MSVRALRNLESGAGSTVRTLVSVLRALGRHEWLNTVAPVATINPLTNEKDRAASPARDPYPPETAGLTAKCEPDVRNQAARETGVEIYSRKVRAEHESATATATADATADAEEGPDKAVQAR